MIINPFSENNKVKNLNILCNKNNEIEIDNNEILKYLIDNYLEYIKKNDRDSISEFIKKYLYEKYNIDDEKIYTKIQNKIVNKMFGYDILEKYIKNEDVSDIRAVSFNNIYIKKKGKWIKVNDKFESEKEFDEYIRYIVLKNGGNINFDIPIIIVSDKIYNLRIEAGISPVNCISSSIVIRIHRKNDNSNLENLCLIENMFNPKIYIFLNDIIKNQKNVVISGKGGSGKTTLLRALINKIPEEIAITSNEETMELFFENRNIIQREVIENREESKKITLEKLTKHSLVMSNDVIIIGELKGKEALMFFDSIATGHEGFATVHSDSSLNTIDRLITLVKRDENAQQYKEAFIGKMLASSIDYIIFMKNYKINEIASVRYNNENEKIILNILFKYKEEKNDIFENFDYYICNIDERM